MASQRTVRHNGVQRVVPGLPAHAVKTYTIAAPPSTHYREASCKEVECAAHAWGWVTNCDVDAPLGAAQANYIRLHSGRRFTFSQAGSLVTFEFPAGQRCFVTHRVPLERPALYVVREGDWRGNPRGAPVRRHRNGDDWVDDFGEHQQRLADRFAQG